ncbi:hypothetical protein CWE12_05800 [Aliidiomarina sedimenti]|uniref:Uncharacterized protein n=1 Tax=Aliidiomarina sedimenti TaxID=1933879 RepID=A0ABY0C0Q4_9GAMM|nr:hypothetical protein [Aliidiomarina sedimenti]RUO30753.1 hypothetical protein CWE12_05800 [Aliidiomarina sedimenti]
MTDQRMNKTQGSNAKADGQRLLWLALAMVALTIPLWYEIALQPGTYVFAWRWTEQQVMIESIVSVLHLIVVIAGVVMLKRAVGDMPQWPLIRIGAWVWTGLVGLLALFAIVMFQVSDDTVLESIEGEGYRINAVRSGGEVAERTQINVVFSCNHTLLYKNILYLDRLATVNEVDMNIDEDELHIRYRWDERMVQEERYSISDFYRQCREE